MSHQFTFKTWSETRSNRRDRTYTVEADDFATAHDLAIAEAMKATRAWDRAHYATLTDVDGHGPPEDCSHLEYHETAKWSDGTPVVVSAFAHGTTGARICLDCAAR